MRRSSEFATRGPSEGSVLSSVALYSSFFESWRRRRAPAHRRPEPVDISNSATAPIGTTFSTPVNAVPPGPPGVDIVTGPEGVLLGATAREAAVGKIAHAIMSSVAAETAIRPAVVSRRLCRLLRCGAFLTSRLALPSETT